MTSDQTTKGYQNYAKTTLRYVIIKPQLVWYIYKRIHLGSYNGTDCHSYSQGQSRHSSPTKHESNQMVRIFRLEIVGGQKCANCTCVKTVVCPLGLHRASIGPISSTQLCPRSPRRLPKILYHWLNHLSRTSLELSTACPGIYEGMGVSGMGYWVWDIGYGCWRVGMGVAGMPSNQDPPS